MFLTRLNIGMTCQVVQPNSTFVVFFPAIFSLILEATVHGAITLPTVATAANADSSFALAATYLQERECFSYVRFVPVFIVSQP